MTPVQQARDTFYRTINEALHDAPDPNLAKSIIYATATSNVVGREPHPQRVANQHTLLKRVLEDEPLGPTTDHLLASGILQEEQGYLVVPHAIGDFVMSMDGPRTLYVTPADSEGLARIVEATSDLAVYTFQASAKPPGEHLPEELRAARDQLEDLWITYRRSHTPSYMHDRIKPLGVDITTVKPTGYSGPLTAEQIREHPPNQGTGDLKNEGEPRHLLSIPEEAVISVQREEDTYIFTIRNMLGKGSVNILPHRVQQAVREAQPRLVERVNQALNEAQGL